jgi:hypothetical protein
VNTAGCRRLFVLIRHLPQDAALWRVYKPPQAVETDPNAIATFFGGGK